jgi:hypothetical protein
MILVILKFEASGARGIRHHGDLAAVEVASAIEDDFGDLGRLGLLGDLYADFLGAFDRLGSFDFA